MLKWSRCRAELTFIFALLLYSLVGHVSCKLFAAVSVFTICDLSFYIVMVCQNSGRDIFSFMGCSLPLLTLPLGVGAMLCFPSLGSGVAPDMSLLLHQVLMHLLVIGALVDPDTLLVRLCHRMRHFNRSAWASPQLGAHVSNLPALFLCARNAPELDSRGKDYNRSIPLDKIELDTHVLTRIFIPGFQIQRKQDMSAGNYPRNQL
jgi:hypothetical protein